MREVEEQQQQGLFQNGMEFLYPRCEDGPSVYALMEGAWVFVALIQGIRQRVWESDPRVPNAVAAAWARAGLLEVEQASGETPATDRAVLTPAGIRVAACADLLEYEFGMMQQQLDGNHKTDPAKYKALRGGLEAYTTNFMQDIVKWVNDSNASQQPVTFFDFCGGNGGYLRSFLEANPGSQGMLFDRAPGIQKLDATLNRMAIMAGDAFGEDQWFASQAGGYDIVLLSEILHCKGGADRQLLLLRAKSLLKPDGVILVVEQYPTLRLEWRMQDMTDGGQALPSQLVVAEAAEAGFAAVSGIYGFTHYGLRLEQI